MQKTKYLNLRITPEQHAEWKQLAYARDVSLAKLIHIAMDAYKESRNETITSYVKDNETGEYVVARTYTESRKPTEPRKPTYDPNTISDIWDAMGDLG